MTTEKQVTLKLWYNLSNRVFYVQLNDKLFAVTDKVVTAIQEEEKIDIVHAKDIKDIQFQDRIKK